MTVDIFKKTAVDKLPNDLEGMEASMERLYALIDDAYKYVDDVVVWLSMVLLPFDFLLQDSKCSMIYQEGRVNPDNDIGRFLSDTLASVPKMSPIAFDKVFNDRVQVNACLHL